ncbi:MAG: galactose-1-phosphate uridylyltransferase [Thermodesulfobacteriota bacterium]
MSELRLNLVTRTWVIIAKERANRPEEFKRVRSSEEIPTYKGDCPFCPGNEGMTPPEVYRVAGEDGWKIRVTVNKYGALSQTGARVRCTDGLRRSVSGVGTHEVIVETPCHNGAMALMDVPSIRDILSTYKNRFCDAYNNPNVGHVILFKNHGVGAGTSLQHPHSQLIGSPVTPIQIRDRMEAYVHFYDDTGQCLICMMTETEGDDQSRVILETDEFLTFIPYAALSPFHIWIFPKRHTASFIGITDRELDDLATNLKATLAKLYHGLENPDFNFIIRSNRPKDADSEYFHWYMSIIPRVTMMAGFELGSGMYINTGIPEESASFLRNVAVD